MNWLAEERARTKNLKKMVVTTPGKKAWGNATWQFLHVMVGSYNPKRMRAPWRRMLFKTIAEICPCPQCRSHLKKRIKELTPAQKKSIFKSRTSLARFLYLLHNDVTRTKCVEKGKRNCSRKRLFSVKRYNRRYSRK